MKEVSKAYHNCEAANLVPCFVDTDVFAIMKCFLYYESINLGDLQFAKFNDWWFHKSNGKTRVFSLVDGSASETN